MSFVSPTLAEAARRYEAARAEGARVAADLSEETFHRRTPDGGWSIAHCLEHLVVTDGRMAAALEDAIARARAEGRVASASVASSPARFGWFDRFFIHATSPRKEGAKAPPMKGSAPAPYDPGDPLARGRRREDVVADYEAIVARMIAAMRAADGLDVARIKVPSAAASWVKVSIGAWFVALAGHHERHLDQARRARAAVADPGWS